MVRWDHAFCNDVGPYLILTNDHVEIVRYAVNRTMYMGKWLRQHYQGREGRFESAVGLVVRSFNAGLVV